MCRWQRTWTAFLPSQHPAAERGEKRQAVGLNRRWKVLEKTPHHHAVKNISHRGIGITLAKARVSRLWFQSGTPSAAAQLCASCGAIQTGNDTKNTSPQNAVKTQRYDKSVKKSLCEDGEYELEFLAWVALSTFLFEISTNIMWKLEFQRGVLLSS